MKALYGVLLLISVALMGCYNGKCFQCRKFAPASNGNGTVYIGSEKVCPDKDNIYLVDPEPGDSTDLWECKE